MDSDQPAIAAAIIVDDQRVLLVRRRVAEGTLSWQFPAGAVESGETPAEAAVRETREETGLEVKPLDHLGERTHPATGRKMHYIACKPIASNEIAIADPEELDAVAWTNQAELAVRIPAGLFEPVTAYLEKTLNEPGQAVV